jgi:hypothetical protein
MFYFHVVWSNVVFFFCIGVDLPKEFPKAVPRIKSNKHFFCFLEMAQVMQKEFAYIKPSYDLPEFPWNYVKKRHSQEHPLWTAFKKDWKRENKRIHDAELRYDNFINKLTRKIADEMGKPIPDEDKINKLTRQRIGAFAQLNSWVDLENRLQEEWDHVYNTFNGVFNVY